MRIGKNPLTKEHATAANPTSVASVIVHLPNLTGYHAQRFEVVKLCLRSMRNHCGGAAVMVWDNGSCPEVREWLLEYEPDYIVMSPNIGKQSARANIMHMFPPHIIVGISDDDMLFYPDWFAKSAVILRNFPNVGVVSGYPVRTQFRWGCENTIRWAQKNAIAEVGKFIPEQWDRDFCDSIERPYAVQKQGTVNDYDTRITYNGRQAYATGHHCQFIAFNDRIAHYCVWNDAAMGEEKTFDISIDQAGLLRLTTVERLSRHIGNVLDVSILQDAQKLGLLQEELCQV
jgi:hypothetical protein